MSETNQKIRLISQLRSTLANHANTMSLLPPHGDIASKMREIDSMLRERITSLERELVEADGISIRSVQAAPTIDIAARTPVPVTESDDLARPYTRGLPYMPATSEEIERFQQRPPPLEIVDVQRPMLVFTVRRNRRRGRFRSSALNRLVPTRINTPFLHRPMR